MKAVKEVAKDYENMLDPMQKKLNLIMAFNSEIDKTERLVNGVLGKWAAVAAILPGQALNNTLNSQLQQAQKGLQNAFSAMRTTFAQTQNATQAVQAGINQLTAALTSAQIALGALVGLLFLTHRILSGINQDVTDLSQNSGMAATHAYELYKNALDTQTQFSNQLATLKEILAVQQGITTATGIVIQMEPETLSRITNASKALGYSAESAGHLQVMFEELGANEKVASNLQVVTGELAKANRLAPGMITQDLLDNANLVAEFFAGYPEKAAEAAVAVRKMGYNLSQVGKTMEHLFNVEGSIVAQMEASLATGRFIDVSQARRLFLAGKMEEAMKSITQLAGSYAEFERMGLVQKRLLAKALGMEVGELQRSLYIREKLSGLSEEEKQNAMKHLSHLKSMSDLQNANLQAEIAKSQQAEKFNVAIEKVKNAMIRALLPAVEALVPLLEGVSMIVSGLAYLLKPIQYIIEGLVFPLRLITNLFTSGKEMSESIKDSWNELSASGLSGIPQVFAAMLSGAGALYAMFKGIPLLFKGIGAAFSKAMLPSIQSVGSKIKNVFNPQQAGGIAKAPNLPSGYRYLSGNPQGRKPGTAASKAAGDRAFANRPGVIQRIKDRFKKPKQTTTTPGSKQPGILQRIKEKFTKPSQPTTTKTQKTTTDKKGIVSKLKDKLTFNKKQQTVVDQASTATANASKQAAKVKPGIGERFKVFLTNFGQGLQNLGKKIKEKMKGIAVLTVAGIALTGSFALALKMVKGVKASTMLAFSSSLAILGTSLSLLGKQKAGVTKGASALAIASLGLIPAAYSFKMIAGVDTGKIVAFGIAMSGFALSLGFVGKLKSQVLQGAFALAIAGVGLIPFAYSMKIAKGIDLKSVAILAGAAVVFGLGIAAAAPLAPAMLAGAVGLAAAGLALLPFAMALKMVSGVDMKSIGALLGAVAGMSALAAGLSFAAPFLIVGAGAIATLGLALMPFAVSAAIAGKAMQAIGGGMIKLSEAISQLPMDKFDQFNEKFKLLQSQLAEVDFKKLSVSGEAAASMSVIAYSINLMAESINSLPIDQFDQFNERLGVLQQKVATLDVKKLALLSKIRIGPLAANGKNKIKTTRVVRNFNTTEKAVSKNPFERTKRSRTYSSPDPAAWSKVDPDIAKELRQITKEMGISAKTQKTTTKTRLEADSQKGAYEQTKQTTIKRIPSVKPPKYPSESTATKKNDKQSTPQFTSTQKIENTLNKLLFAVERLGANPPAVLIEFDDGTVRKVESRIKRQR